MRFVVLIAAINTILFAVVFVALRVMFGWPAGGDVPPEPLFLAILFIVLFLFGAFLGAPITLLIRRFLPARAASYVLSGLLTGLASGLLLFTQRSTPFFVMPLLAAALGALSGLLWWRLVARGEVEVEPNA